MEENRVADYVCFIYMDSFPDVQYLVEVRRFHCPTFCDQQAINVAVRSQNMIAKSRIA